MYRGKDSYSEAPEKEADEKIVDDSSKNEEEEKYDDFKISDVSEDYFNDKNSMNEIKNFCQIVKYVV